MTEQTHYLKFCPSHPEPPAHVCPSIDAHKLAEEIATRNVDLWTFQMEAFAVAQGWKVTGRDEAERQRMIRLVAGDAESIINAHLQDRQ